MNQERAFSLTTTGVSLRSPELLQIRNGMSISYGAHQAWYRSLMGRMGGCGPTAASNLLWYLAASRPDVCGPLFDGDGTQRAEMTRLMDAVWPYITPGMGGVHKASMLADGLVRYGADHGVSLLPDVLEIPAEATMRPSVEIQQQFLASAFTDDLPVAFLNLSGGAVSNLESWHWVTLVGVDEKGQAEMYDQGSHQRLDMPLWLETTRKGGALVVAKPIQY